jgi:hypothetical protein
MKNRVVWLSVAALSVLGLALSGCELEEDCDPTVTDCTDASTTDTGTDQGSDQSNDVVQGQTYHYVMVTDLTDPDISSPTSTAGADIDAIELEADGDSFFATRVDDFAEGPGDNDFGDDPNEALNSPEGECPTSGSANYYSLGGTGGFIIVSFAQLQQIQTGDTIRVYECGATEEDYQAEVGVGTDPSDPNWVRVITAGTGIQEGTVGTLPFVDPN